MSKIWSGKALETMHVSYVRSILEYTDILFCNTPKEKEPGRLYFAQLDLQRLFQGRRHRPGWSDIPAEYTIWNGKFWHFHGGGCMPPPPQLTTTHTHRSYQYPLATALNLTYRWHWNSFNKFIVIDPVENEVLHKKISLLFRKLEKIQNGPPATILNFASHKSPASLWRGSPPGLYS